MKRAVFWPLRLAGKASPEVELEVEVMLRSLGDESTATSARVERSRLDLHNLQSNRQALATIQFRAVNNTSLRLPRKTSFSAVYVLRQICAKDNGPADVCGD
ncbi:hypothetical protein J6590_030581 [Homalodisca vitripennis]|nr:hypothetical protein J6590_030581 [Homalodisca vitripennis]